MSVFGCFMAPQFTEGMANAECSAFFLSDERRAFKASCQRIDGIKMEAEQNTRNDSRCRGEAKHHAPTEESAKDANNQPSSTAAVSGGDFRKAEPENDTKRWSQKTAMQSNPVVAVGIIGASSQTTSVNRLFFANSMEKRM